MPNPDPFITLTDAQTGKRVLVRRGAIETISPYQDGAYLTLFSENAFAVVQPLSEIEALLAAPAPRQEAMVADTALLDKAWAEISVMGYRGSNSREFIEGIQHGRRTALSLIEHLGGMDPQARAKRSDITPSPAPEPMAPCAALLDSVFRKIDAMGYEGPPRSPEWEDGHHTAALQALAIIEEFGGMDPVLRAAREGSR